jgi:hypothetical protein
LRGTAPRKLERIHTGNAGPAATYIIVNEMTDDGASELILHRIDQAAYEAGVDPSETSHTVRVWQLAPIRTEWTAVVPVRSGHEDEVRELLIKLLSGCPGVDGGPPRNAVGLLERWACRRGMRYAPGERASWPEASASSGAARSPSSRPRPATPAVRPAMIRAQRRRSSR